MQSTYSKLFEVMAIRYQLLKLVVKDRTGYQFKILTIAETAQKR